MTIKQCIDKFLDIYPNEFKTENYIDWLYELDAKIINELVRHYFADASINEANPTGEEKRKIKKSDYDESHQDTTVLFVAEPYSEMYLYWLQAKVDYYTSEINRYQNSVVMFNNTYQQYANFYNQTHTALSRELNFFGAEPTTNSPLD